MLLFRLEMVKTKMIIQKGSELLKIIEKKVKDKFPDKPDDWCKVAELACLRIHLEGTIILDEAELREIIVDQERLMDRENVPKHLRHKNHSITIEELLGENKIESS